MSLTNSFDKVFSHMVGSKAFSYPLTQSVDGGEGDNLGVLLIHSDTTDGSTTFVDSSPSGHTITVNGDVHHETDQAKFGSSSINFDGSGDYLSILDSDDWNVGSGDFTIDFWFKINNTNRGYICGQMNSAGASASSNLLIQIQSGGNVRITQGVTTGAGYFIWDPGFTLSDLLSFHHFALVRNGNTLTGYLDGVAGGTTKDCTGLTFTDQALPFIIGRGGSFDSYNFNGYIDEFRLVKGTAIWTSNFTPPTSPYA